MSKFVEEVWGQTNNPGGGGILERLVKWPGGRGQIIVVGFSASAGIEIALAQAMPGLGVSFSDFPNVPNISASGVYSFEAPESEIRFTVSLNSGDNFFVSRVGVVQTV
jgi:hypothetical protein